MTTATAQQRTQESYTSPLKGRRAQLKAVTTAELIEQPKPRLETPGFKIVRDDFTASADGAVRWGWRQWIAIAPDVRKFLDKTGKHHGFAGAMVKAQRKHLPKAQHRTLGSLSVACAPSAPFNVEACIRFITDHPDPQSLIGQLSVPTVRKQWQKPLKSTDEQLAARRAMHAENIEGETAEQRRKRVQREKKQIWRAEQKRKLDQLHESRRTYTAKAQDARDARAAEIDTLFQQEIARDKLKEQERFQEGRIGPLNSPEQLVEAKARKTRAARQTVATPHADSDDALQSFLATPIGVFAPVLKAFITQTLGELLKPHHALIAETVRAAVIDVVGAPTTEAKSAQPAQPLAFDLELDVEIEPKRETKPETKASEAPEQLQETTQETSAERAAREALAEAPHDLESQLALAARALNLPMPGKKESVILVNFQPKIEHEIEKFYGRAFRFVFKRSHQFAGASDLPPSTDGVILCKTRLTHELVGLTRRYAIPVQHAPNTSSGALWALKQMFPESTETFTEVRH